jgi:hypothetical protein
VEGVDDLSSELRRLRQVVERLELVGREIVVGGSELTEATKTQERRTRELIDGGEDLTEVSRQLEADLQVFRAVVPRILRALDTVDRLEGEVETVAETIEPLQGAAERVGRVTRRLSRTP